MEDEKGPKEKPEKLPVQTVDDRGASHKLPPGMELDPLRLQDTGTYGAQGLGTDMIRPDDDDTDMRIPFDDPEKERKFWEDLKNENERLIAEEIQHRVQNAFDPNRPEHAQLEQTGKIIRFPQ